MMRDFFDEKAPRRHPNISRRMAGHLLFAISCIARRGLVVWLPPCGPLHISYTMTCLKIDKIDVAYVTADTSFSCRNIEPPTT